MHSEQEAIRRGETPMTQDRRRCGWGAVLAAVTLFATLVLTVPPGPGLS
jgi:hypothetical protein